MEIDTVLEIINTHPILYFTAGLVVGYLLHMIVSKGFSSTFRNKKPSRYQSKKGDSSVKRASAIVELNEPSFDWPDAAVKTMKPPQFISLSLDQHGNRV
jgi:hypothetical protein